MNKTKSTRKQTALATPHRATQPSSLPALEAATQDIKNDPISDSDLHDPFDNEDDDRYDESRTLVVSDPHSQNHISSTLTQTVVPDLQKIESSIAQIIERLDNKEIEEYDDADKLLTE